MEFESNLKSESVDALFDAILTLENREDCYRFFTDICTIHEIQSISQRLAVAKLLSKGCTYSEIEEKTKASTATISRINKCLIYGADGYRRVIRRLEEKEKEADPDNSKESEGA
ncbi:MAG: YerC/YecD family TrpR-related protein [Eubacteriales bacterium]|nr:YerC/YecD family TrpR-related protein [Eubacteriales bacterium]